MSTDKHVEQRLPLSAMDYHVLVALVEEDLYGYAIMKAVEEDSRGAVPTGIGSLYRILARLVNDGLVREVDAPDGAPTEHRGRPRRYYGLTPEGRLTIQRESLRLQDVVELARQRSLLPEALG